VFVGFHGGLSLLLFVPFLLVRFLVLLVLVLLLVLVVSVVAVRVPGSRWVTFPSASMVNG
jgi:hypothetical protein